MSIQFLVATTDKIDLKFSKSIFCKLYSEDYSVLIVNQFINIPKSEIKVKDQKIGYISSKSRGVSKNRNLALEKADGDVCVITDEDVTYLPHSIDIINKTYAEDDSLDAAIFQIVTPEGIPYKKYKNKSFRIKNGIAQYRVSSIEITFRRESVMTKGIRFNENVGLGTKYTSGEEALFINDCVRNGLKVKYFPIQIVQHPKESSGKSFSRSNTIANGIVFKKLFPYTFLLYDIYFSIKRFPRYKSELSLIEYFTLLWKGNQLVLQNKV